jgi:pyruvate-formate lyase
MDCCLSPHEQFLQDQIEGRENKFRSDKAHARAFKILDRVQNLTPKVDIERGKYFTESMMQTEGQPLVLRWAKAMMNVAQNITVYIEDDQLLVGRSGSMGRYGILYPELDGDFLDLAVEELEKRDVSPFIIEEADAKVMIEDIAPYWKGKTYHEALANAIPAETLPYTYNPENVLESRFIVNETSSFRSSLQWVHDYEKVLKRGFGGLKKEAQDKLKALDPFSPIDNTKNKPFLEAVIILCDAVILWANRHAALAEKMAREESDPVRKAELEQIAEICKHVPEHPARNFREAMQSQWFTQMFSRIESKTGTIISNGRMDQYLYPYYKADIEAGNLDEEQAIELFECMWVGMAEFIDLYLSPTGGAFNEGYAHWEAVTVGGQTPDGRDASNDLTYLILRSKREFPLHYPDLAARVHSRAPKRYLWELAQTIKEGSGFPKLINDEEVIPLHLSKGASFEEIHDYAVSGCAEIRMPNRDTYNSGCAYINFAAALEMTMYGGKMQKYGDERIGLDTGDPVKFTEWDQFYDSYKAQHLNFIKQAFIQQAVVINLRPNHFAVPLASAVHDLCMENMVDLTTPKIEGGIDLGYFECIGYGTVVDSLSAIKKLVFEEKKLTMAELLEATRNNFEGAEDVRAMLRNVPCYGNNDSYADEIGKGNRPHLPGLHQEVLQGAGRAPGPRLVPFTSHVPFGKVVSATPNGRYAYTPLSDGSSAPPTARTSTAPPPSCCPTSPPRTTTTASGRPGC